MPTDLAHSKLTLQRGHLGKLSGDGAEVEPGAVLKGWLTDLAPKITLQLRIANCYLLVS